MTVLYLRSHIEVGVNWNDCRKVSIMGFFLPSLRDTATRELRALSFKALSFKGKQTIKWHEHGQKGRGEQSDHPKNIYYTRQRSNAFNMYMRKEIVFRLCLERELGDNTKKMVERHGR